MSTPAKKSGRQVRASDLAPREPGKAWAMGEPETPWGSGVLTREKNMNRKSETASLGRSVSKVATGRPPLSRRDVVKGFLLAPLALQPVMGEAPKRERSSPCCHGNFRPDDLFAAKSLIGDLQRARHGDLAATLRAGFAYYTGMGGRLDIARARSYFLVASQGSVAGSAWLGYVDAATDGKPGRAARRSASFQGLVKAAEAGDPVGQTLLGRVYERGLAGYRRKPDKAQALYEAAAPNFALAKTYLGRLLLKGGASKQAIALFKDAAKAGETTAMISLADLYSRMKRPAAKIPEMKRRLRAAAKKGDSEALYLLGMQYLQGATGFRANPQRALKLLHKSATRGHKRAQNALATAYANGAGGAASAPQLAQFWARKASLPSLNRPGPPAGPAKKRSATAG